MGLLSGLTFMVCSQELYSKHKVKGHIMFFINYVPELMNLYEVCQSDGDTFLSFCRIFCLLFWSL